ncbi:DUF4097 domain-containing protein [Paenibacillus allorhizosphaerae]|uniref:DUF4097 domain-containing protein n=1 Tax=Paenibacillus allorhizosphaerae TaxID=2849866 RepID=A0ABN7TQ56_9BACL|nr:DUF4097 family beta strand repeat-containing protein [Paenibacillus allorhizosphaerae]CAG7646041.1 hypothetical protein PAECIP111802_03644 [Paenibacillus allorhizosphaerae]
MHKAGRYTAALLLVAVGASVIIDKATGTRLTAELIDWWPLLFICLGVEYLLFNMKYGSTGRPLKLDIPGIIFAVIISAVVIVSTQSADIFKKINGISDIGDVIGSFGEGYKFDKGVTEIPISPAIGNVKINDRDGSVVVKPGNVDKVQVALIMYVKVKDEKEARSIADESKIEYQSSGDTLEIQAAGKQYDGSIIGGKYPRMDLVVTVPAQQKINLEMQTKNGKIEAAQLPIKQRLKAETTNGAISISDLAGELRFETTNGSITSSRTEGPITLKTTNGRVSVTDHRGDAMLESTNGELNVQGIAGNVNAHTTNGSVKVDGKVVKLKAETTNGTVEASSDTISGDWDVRTSNGKIELRLPTQGDYRVAGKGRENGIQSSLPLTVNKKTIEGTIGSGKYAVRFETNGSVSIQPSN